MVGRDNNPLEVLRCLGEEVSLWLTSLFNVILRIHKMPNECRGNALSHCIKIKMMRCYVDRGIQLLNHTMKIMGNSDGEENPMRDGNK